MAQFFPQGSHKMFGSTNPLVPVVRPLPVRARQAMYAAAEKDLIARKTWNGCAWNAAGKIAGVNHVSSYEAAANVFECDVALVERFISKWDGLKGSDARCTALLKAAIEEVGITSNVPTGLVKSIRGYAYKSADTQFREQLADITSLTDIPGFDVELVDGVQVLLNA